MICLAEVFGLVGIAEADQYDAGAGVLKGMTVSMQLHDLFAAKRSPVMAKEDQHQKLVFPKGFKAFLCSIG